MDWRASGARRSCTVSSGNAVEEQYNHEAHGRWMQMAKLDMDAELGGETTVIEEKSEKKPRGRAAPKKMEKIDVPPLELEHLIVPIIGDTDLIVNNFSKKSKQQMLDKQMQVPQQKRTKKVPEEDFLGSLYILDGKPKLVKKGDRTYAVGFTPGFPANALKNVAVAACTAIDGIFKTVARQAFHVDGYTLPILDAKTGKPAVPWMRDDVVRLAGPRPVADIRFRACFENWMIKIPLTYNKRMIDPTRIVHLFNNAGFGVGIGEWRPECDGPYGRFSVMTTHKR